MPCAIVIIISRAAFTDIGRACISPLLLLSLQCAVSDIFRHGENVSVVFISVQDRINAVVKV